LPTKPAKADPHDNNFNGSRFGMGLLISSKKNHIKVSAHSTIARVDPDSFTPRYQRLDLSSFVQERVASLAPLALRKSIDIDMNIKGTHFLKIDPESLISAIDNVLDNAIRYTPNGEKITVEIHSDETYVVLSIADSGVRIPIEH
jgi:signal transduction histidine kinase